MDFKDRVSYYKKYRHPDRRLTMAMVTSLGLTHGATIVDVGAGTGNYASDLSDMGYSVIAVEPESGMRMASCDCRLAWNASFAEKINMQSECCDAVISINAIHHFSNLNKALGEMYRIVKLNHKVSIFTFDPDVALRLWFFSYWPSLATVERQRYLPLEDVCHELEQVFGEPPIIETFRLPRDFRDVFAAALWARPELMLEQEYHKASSLLEGLSEHEMKYGLERLKSDLQSGKWAREWLNRPCDSCDVGARILTVCRRRNM